jgi:hypothetical protein
MGHTECIRNENCMHNSYWKILMERTICKSQAQIKEEYSNRLEKEAMKM